MTNQKFPTTMRSEATRTLGKGNVKMRGVQAPGSGEENALLPPQIQCEK